jgi:hypothetical protein
LGTLLAPPAIKLHGVTIGVDPRPTYGDYWVIWRDWADVTATERNWTDWVKPQIDYAVGQAGANCIGLLVSYMAYHDGLVSLAQSQAQLVQFVSYCKSLGVWVYLRQADGHRNFNTSFVTITPPTPAVVAAYWDSLLSSIAAYDNVIGLDTIVEAESNNWGAGTYDPAVATYQRSLYSQLKALQPNMPLASSMTAAPGNATGQTWAASLSFDFLSFDAYRSNNWPANVAPGAGGDHRSILWSDIAYWRTTYPNDDILFSEAGVNTQATEALNGGTEDQEDEFIAGLHQLVDSGDVRIRGVLEWNCADKNTAAADNWGLQVLSSSVWAPRLHRTRLLRRYAPGPIPRN